MSLEFLGVLQYLFTWIFYLFNAVSLDNADEVVLQSLFTWIFYLFYYEKGTLINVLTRLQSLFTWIFYLFIVKYQKSRGKSTGFNPYSPGFSIYLMSEIDRVIEEI